MAEGGNGVKRWRGCEMLIGLMPRGVVPSGLMPAKPWGRDAPWVDAVASAPPKPIMHIVANMNTSRVKGKPGLALPA